MSDLIKICGLQKIERDDKTYLTGVLGSSRVFILRNRYKKTSDDPDYNLFVAAEKAKRRSNGDPAKDEAPLPEPEIPF